MLKPGERLDDIGFGNLRLIQKPEDFCYGIDAVLLADFASQKKVDTIIDLGTGTGIIPHILSHKTSAKEIVGLEYQRSSFELAVRNAALNDLEGRLKFYCADVSTYSEKARWADAVTTNPPYMASQGGLTNSNKAKTIARHETVGTLEDFIKCGERVLKDKGDFYMVHRPSRLVDIFHLCRSYRLEPKELQLIAPRNGETPNILLLHCVKNGGAELKLIKTLNVYDENGLYSKEITQIYERVR